MADLEKEWESASPIVGENTKSTDTESSKPRGGPTIGRKIFDSAANIGSGALKGVAGIGTTLLWPVDKATDLVMGDRKGKPGRNEERDKAITQFLVDEGADPKSWSYAGGKLGAEIAGTAGAGGAISSILRRIPGVAGSIPNVLKAVETSGMYGGGMGTRMLGGAVSGGAQGLLADRENAGSAAMIGAALPPVLKGVGAAGNFLGSMTRQGATNSAVRKIGETLDDVGQAVGDLQTYYPKGAENIPVSAAGIIGKPAIAQLEQASRIKVPAPWYEFDQKQGKAVFDNVLSATKEAEEIGARAKTRSSNWDIAWQKATENEKPKIWQWGMQRFVSDLDNAMLSAEASNPQVMASLKQIKGEIERLGDKFTPSHLQQLRAELNGKANPLSASPLKTASRDTPAIISLKNEMDSILNASTGGKWQKVIEGYSRDSRILEEARAAQKVRNSYVDPDTGRIRAKALDPSGDVPIITESGLGKAMDMARAPNKSLMLSDPANQQLEATLGALRRQAIVQGVKRSVTAGGGSDTAANIAAIATHSVVPGAGGNVAVTLADLLRRITATRTDKQIAALLSNPDELAKELPKLLQQQAGGNVISPSLTRSAPLAVPFLMANPANRE